MWNLKVILTVTFASIAIASADVSLSHIFSSNMVLQRNAQIPVWGKGDAGENVVVELNGQRVTTKVGADGKWKLAFEPIPAGGPYKMVIAGNNRIVLSNILIGEVWVCSGQSNMEFGVASWLDAGKEIQSATNPEIRLFTVPRTIKDTPQYECYGEWQICSPENIGKFSAVGYFFGKELQRELKVPVGLINCSYSGSAAEAWMSRNALQSNPDFLPILSRYKTALAQYPLAKKEYDIKYAQWEKKKNLPKVHADSGNKGFAAGWAAQGFNANNWNEMTLPCTFETVANIDGAVWFRREVIIPDSWAGKDIILQLGTVDDYDATYFNGQLIGTTTGLADNAYTLIRKYNVPGKIVRKGKNLIAARVFDRFGNGGFTGTADEMKLINANGNTLPLAGQWKYKIEKRLNPDALQPPCPSPPLGPDNCQAPIGLYNGMLCPIMPYAIRGVIWYQGESNTTRAYQYRKLFPTLIAEWRKNWRQGNFPFLFVQLANFGPLQQKPEENSWAELREAQLMTLSLPNTGMAVTIDIGDANDIHPKNKQEVGRRLSLWALAKTYAISVEYSGPTYKSMKREGQQIRIELGNTAKGLITKGLNALKGFAIAGTDKKFFWANAKIDGNTIIVSSPEVKSPVAVRYGWGQNPECNLFNSEGLPASPFRTDDWPGRTANSN